MRIINSAAAVGIIATLAPLGPTPGFAAAAKQPRSGVLRAAQIPPARPVLRKATHSAANADATRKDATLTRLVEAPRPLSAYEQARHDANALRLDSISAVQENLPTLAGRKVEFKGEVVGFMTTAQGRTMMLNIDNSVAVLNLSPQLAADAASSAALRPGAIVRVLVDVQMPGAHTMASTLSIVAATDEPEPEKLFKDSVDDSDDNTDLIVVPPMTSMMLPPPPKATPQESMRRAVQPGAGIGDSSDIESQLPFYKNIIIQHNKKLKPAQVDEIARALLTAGYANNMDPRFLAAIIAVESDFDIYCLSSSGAMGLGQLMPFNLKEAGIRNPWNPTENIIGTARLLRGHLNDYKNRPNGTLLAVAAYNAGPGAVRRAGYKVPNGSQVQRYVWKVYYRYKSFAPDMFK